MPGRRSHFLRRKEAESCNRASNRTQLNHLSEFTLTVGHSGPTVSLGTTYYVLGAVVSSGNTLGEKLDLSCASLSISKGTCLEVSAQESDLKVCGFEKAN